jgi:hypothetical protein
VPKLVFGLNEKQKIDIHWPCPSFVEIPHKPDAAWIIDGMLVFRAKKAIAKA